MKITTLRDQGDARVLEDSLIDHPPFYGVLDALSGIYLSGQEPEFCVGENPRRVSGGEFVSYIFFQEVFVASAFNLRKLAVDTNESLRKKLEIFQLDLNDASVLPGACLAVAKNSRSRKFCQNAFYDKIK